jgi:hypothetical protein
MNSIRGTRKFGGKKYGTKTYPPEKCMSPEFVKEVECSLQDVKDGKGIKFNTVGDFFSSLEKLRIR